MTSRKYESPAAFKQSLEQTFVFRKTHTLPSSLPEPPSSWMEVYRRMVEEDELEWQTLPDLVAAVRVFLDPVLNGEPVARWSPSRWRWGSTKEH